MQTLALCLDFDGNPELTSALPRLRGRSERRAQPFAALRLILRLAS